MSRLTRINTIWRKELIDTLRDRRTLIAMILVPLVLYPALMVGSLQGIQLQNARLEEETYRVGVNTPELAAWLRTLLGGADLAHRPGAEGLPAEEIVAREERGDLPADEPNRPWAARSR